MTMQAGPATNSTLSAAPVGLGWRLLALLYDALPVIALLMVVSAVFLWLNGGQTVEQDPALALLQFVCAWLLIGAYFVLSWRRGGQTVGMRPWRLKVVGADGRPASWGRLCVRYVVACITPVVGLAWTLFEPRHRALHDIAAQTLVVRLEKTTGG